MADCGSLTAYNYDKCRCAACRAAYASYQRERRARLRGQPLPAGVEHGMATAYATYGCRCAPCVEMKREYDKQRRELLAEPLREQRAAYRRENLEALRAGARASYRQDPETYKARAKAYQRTDRGRMSKRAVWLRRKGVAFTMAGREQAALAVGDPCSYCGRAGGTVDHIVPVATGGDGDWQNVAGACLSCNASKSATSLLQFLLRRPLGEDRSCQAVA